MLLLFNYRRSCGSVHILPVTAILVLTSFHIQELILIKNFYKPTSGNVDASHRKANDSPDVSEDKTSNTFNFSYS
jgi:hypothetical protein